MPPLVILPVPNLGTGVMKFGFSCLGAMALHKHFSLRLHNLYWLAGYIRVQAYCCNYTIIDTSYTHLANAADSQLTFKVQVHALLCYIHQ